MSKTEEEIQAEAKAAADAQAAHEAKLAEIEDKYRKSEEARIRAEAERDAFQKGVAAAQAQNTGGGQQAWTDEQWAGFEERTGFNRKQIEAMTQLQQAQAAETDKKVMAQIEAANKKVADTEAKLASIEAKTGTDAIKSEYLSARPNLARYKTDVDDFLSRFPDSQKQDPKAYKELLGMAEIYVKGKVGAAMNNTPKGGGKVGGFEQGNTDLDAGGEQEGAAVVDVNSFSEYERGTARRIAASLTKEKLEDINSNKAPLGPGVAVSGESEWAAGAPQRAR